MANTEPMRDLYNFKESRFFSLTHGIRVFIFGEEVTEWIRGSVTITYGNRESFNTCSFELSNPHQIWQITPNNIPSSARSYGRGESVDGGTSPYPPKMSIDPVTGLVVTADRPKPTYGEWRKGGGEYSELAKYNIFTQKSYKYLNPMWDLDVTATYLQQQAPSPPANLTTPNPFELPSKHQEYRYRFAIGDCIFNKHDPIRIFVRNPYSLNPLTPQWMEVFCGYVNAHPITTNWLNGESSVRIDCYCIRQMLAKTRCALNIRASMTPEAFMDTGFFQDFAKYEQTTHPFAKTSLESTIRQLVLGTVVESKSNASGGKITPNTNGIGCFSHGNTICYDPANPSDTLERWHLLTMFGVHKAGFPRRGQNLWLSDDDVAYLGEQTLPLPPDKDAGIIGGPDNRYLHFLLPIGGTGATDLCENTQDNPGELPDYATWTTRWEIIRDFASQLDFQVMTSPTGDILVEFPQYGFAPSAYGNPTLVPSNAGASIDMRAAGGLSNLLTFNSHHKEGTLNDEAEDFPSILVVEGGQASAGNVGDAADKAKSVAAGARAYVYSPVLVSRYGVIVETCSRPFAGQGVATDLNIAARLAKLGVLEFTRRMAASSSIDTSIVYRPFLFPNRPVWFQRDYRIGVLNSVTHTWNIRQDATTSVSVGMLMAERHDGSFRLLTGSGNSPIDYAAMWADCLGIPCKDVPSPQYSGVRTSYQDKPKKDAGVSSSNNNTTAGAPYPSIANTPASAGTDGLYPPFAKMIDKLIAKWNAENPTNPVRINSGFRSTATQKNIKDSKKHDASMPASEPGRSLHEWGLAVDLGTKVTWGRMNKDTKKDGYWPSDITAEYMKLSEFIKRESGSFGIKWLNMSDPVHFEMDRYKWNFTVSKLQASRAQNEASMGENAYQAIWEELNGKFVRPGGLTAESFNSPANNSTQPQTSAAPADVSTGTFSTTPGVCSPIFDTPTTGDL